MKKVLCVTENHLCPHMQDLEKCQTDGQAQTQRAPGALVRFLAQPRFQRSLFL